jgi:hypothetical protein
MAEVDSPLMAAWLNLELSLDSLGEGEVRLDQHLLL